MPPISKQPESKSLQIAVKSKPTLLLILPGNEGRKPVLEALVEFANIVVVLFVGGRDAEWVKPFVQGCIEVPQGSDNGVFNTSYEIVSNWFVNDESLPDGIMCYDEYGVELSSYLCEKFCLPGTPFGTMRMFRNKLAFRNACSEAGLCSIRYKHIKSEADINDVLQDKDWPFPSVLKPRKGAGSWHVHKIENRSDLLKIYHSLDENLRAGYFPVNIKDAGFLLEEYFEGAEVDIDGWATNGKVTFQLVSDNYPATEPYFLEQGGNYPSQLPLEAVNAFKDLTEKVLKLFSGVHSCFHFEAKMNLETMKLLPIEFNCRVGGAECPLSVEAVTGYYLPVVAARLALALPPPLPKRVAHKVVCSTNFYPDKAGVLTKNCHEVDAKKSKLVSLTLFQNRIGSNVQANNGSVSCLGWASSGGDSFEEASSNLEMVKKHIHVVVQPEDECKTE